MLVKKLVTCFSILLFCTACQASPVQTAAKNVQTANKDIKTTNFATTITVDSTSQGKQGSNTIFIMGKADTSQDFFYMESNVANNNVTSQSGLHVFAKDKTYYVNNPTTNKWQTYTADDTESENFARIGRIFPKLSDKLTEALVSDSQAFVLKDYDDTYALFYEGDYTKISRTIDAILEAYDDVTSFKNFKNVTLSVIVNKKTNYVDTYALQFDFEKDGDSYHLAHTSSFLDINKQIDATIPNYVKNNK